MWRPQLFGAQGEEQSLVASSRQLPHRPPPAGCQPRRCRAHPLQVSDGEEEKEEDDDEEAVPTRLRFCWLSSRMTRCLGVLPPLRAGAHPSATIQELACDRAAPHRGGPLLCVSTTGFALVEEYPTRLVRTMVLLPWECFVTTRVAIAIPVVLARVRTCVIVPW